jgi:phosphoglycerol transferase MdoB-like AlkP superfamily enzyme
MPKTTNSNSNLRKKQLQNETDQEMAARMVLGFLVSSLTIVILLTLLSILGFLNYDGSLSIVFYPGGIIGLFSAFAGPKIIHFFSNKWSNIFCVIALSFMVSLLFIIGLIIL